MAVLSKNEIFCVDFNFFTNGTNDGPPFAFGAFAIVVDDILDFRTNDLPTTRSISVRRIVFEELANFACAFFFLFEFVQDEIDF